MRGFALALFVFCLALVLSWEAKAAALLMFEEPGCPYCEAWKAEIGPIYPNTDLGKAYPVKFMDIFSATPEEFSLKSAPMVSPTFVLVDDQGQEIGRILGYPGEDFFWWFLEEQAKPSRP